MFVLARKTAAAWSCFVLNRDTVCAPRPGVPVPELCAVPRFFLPAVFPLEETALKQYRAPQLMFSASDIRQAAVSGKSTLPLVVVIVGPTSLTATYLPYFQDDEDVVSIALEDIVVGEEYEGVINNVVTYGAFVDIGTEVRLRAVQS